MSHQDSITNGRGGLSRPPSCMLPASAKDGVPCARSALLARGRRIEKSRGFRRESPSPAESGDSYQSRAPAQTYGLLTSGGGLLELHRLPLGVLLYVHAGKQHWTAGVSAPTVPLVSDLPVTTAVFP